MKICIAGRNSIAVNAIKFLLEEVKFLKEKLSVLCNKTDNGIDTWQPSLMKFSINNGINISSIGELYNINDLIFISLQFDRIIKPNYFKSNYLYNFHFSLLPKYKGMYTSVFPLLFGDDKSGVTLHYIDEGIDTGDIIAQKEFNIALNDTSRDLYLKYLKFGYELFKENITSIINCNIISHKQSNIKSTYFSKNSIDFKNIKIDLRKTSFQIHNQIRAFIFKEYQLPSINNKKIIKSVLTSEKIKRNFYYENGNKIILSGIDCYKIILNIEK